MDKIEQLWKDSDGWWAILKDGYEVDGATGVREDTREALLKRIKDDAKPVARIPPPPLPASKGPDEPKLWLGVDGSLMLEDGSDPSEYLRQFFEKVRPKDGPIPFTIPVGVMHFEGLKRLRRLADDAVYRSD